jgi:type III secretory pathway component EscS
MKFLIFSFKNEATWMMIFALGPIMIATVIFLLVYLIRILF